MKLNLLFTIMNVLTILAYPIVFVYGKLHQFAKPIANINLTNSSVISPVAADRQEIEIA